VIVTEGDAAFSSTPVTPVTATGSSPRSVPWEVRPSDVTAILVIHALDDHIGAAERLAHRARRSPPRPRG
jgi:L-ascorbate metabolism protein UlaG (beta-lactamase superfamily)